MADALFRRRLVSLEVMADRVTAQRLASRFGFRLPSIDELEERKPSSGMLAGVRFPFWASELRVRPESLKFVKGQDIVDRKSGIALPSLYVPDFALGLEGVTLIVRPLGMEVRHGTAVVHPFSVEAEPEDGRRAVAYAGPISAILLRASRKRGPVEGMSYPPTTYQRVAAFAYEKMIYARGWVPSGELYADPDGKTRLDLDAVQKEPGALPLSMVLKAARIGGKCGP